MQEVYYNFSELEYENEIYHAHKFITTCGKIAKRLKKSGISLAFFRKLHFHYFDFDLDGYIFSLEFNCRCYIEQKYKDRLKEKDYIEKATLRMTALLLTRHFITLNKDEEFAKVLANFEQTGSYAELLRRSDEEFQKTKEKNAIAAKFPEKEKPLDLLAITKKGLKDFLQKEPYMTHLTEHDSQIYRTSGSNDLDALYLVGLSIFGSKSSVPVEFDFSPFVDDDSALSSANVFTFLDELRKAIYVRSEVAYGAFGKLDTYKMSLPIPVPDKIQKFHTTKEKGDILENLVAQILESQIGFTVKQKVKRSGEEIDLVITNKIDDPFWNALQSPIILVECKYQKDKVETSALRNFEIKIVDRRGFCRVGIIISLSGFTRGCYDAVTRSSRDGYRIILIDGKMLQERVEKYSSTSQWLEDIIIEQL